MFALTAVTEKLQLKTTSTSEVHVVVSYNDFSATGSSKGVQLVKVTSATTTDIVNAPGASVVRVIERITLKIYGGSANTLTVKYDISATDYEVTPDVPLETGEMYEYENGKGWSRFDASGQLLTAAAGSGIPAGGTTGQVLTKNSGTDYDAGWATPSGGGGSTLTITTCPDTDFNAADDTGYDIQTGDLTGDHNCDVSGITTMCEFFNGQETYRITFVGESVYVFGGSEAVTELSGNLCTRIRRVNSKLIITE